MALKGGKTTGGKTPSSSGLGKGKYVNTNVGIKRT